MNKVYPIGCIIESTTCSTEALVKESYGGNTWIQHSGYVLRGASSGVVANSASKTGGADSVSYTPAGTNGDTGSTTLTAAQSGCPQHTHSVSVTKVGTSNMGITTVASGGAYYAPVAGSGESLSGTASNNQAVSASQGHKHSGSTFTGTQATINTLPQYKSVYIWERTA